MPAAPTDRQRAIRRSDLARESVVLQQNVAPPPDYYRDNLLRIVEFVLDWHGDLLAPSAMVI